MKPRTVSLSLMLLIALAGTVVAGQKQASAAVHGRVSDLWGNPLQGAELKCYRLIYEKGIIASAEGRLEQSTVTDEQGNYTLGGLPPGEYRVTVALQGFRHTEAWRVYLPKESNVLLDLGVEVGLLTETPPIEVTGTVQSSNAALQDVTITVMSAFNSKIVEQARTDKSGRYQIFLRTPGQYVVYASKSGFAVSATAIVPGKLKTVDFVLSPLRR